MFDYSIDEDQLRQDIVRDARNAIAGIDRLLAERSDFSDKNRKRLRRHRERFATLLLKYGGGELESTTTGTQGRVTTPHNTQ